MDPPPVIPATYPARLTLLGNFRLLDRDEPVAIAQPRLHALLAYLALHPRTPQPRQRLAFLFWPDSTEAQAHANLRQLLHLLRNVWPAVDEYLLIDAKSVAWQAESAFQSDVTEFEQALAQAAAALQAGRPVAAATAFETAVALYGGDLLPGCYDDWLLDARERLRQRQIDALGQLIGLCGAARDYPAAIRHAQHRLRADPLHETTYRHLMRLHLLNGDRAHALRTYHTCVTRLQQELGVPPSAETQAEYQRLLQQHAAAPVQTAPASPPVSRAGPPLIGREREWAIVQHAWRQALDQGVHFTCIVGEAGLGKTQLAEELLDWTRRQGIGQAYGRAYAAEGSLAYAPVTEWLRADLFQVVWPQLPDLWLGEVARVRPEILIARPELPRPEPLHEGWQRQRFFEALARTILAAGQPLLLVLDDLQWCDAETLAWLHFLLRFDAAAQLLVVGTLRPEEIDERHPLTPLLVELRSSDRFTEIELTPLTTRASATLAARVAGHDLDHATLNDLYRTSEGNPLFLVEMVRGQETARVGQARAAQQDIAPAVSTPTLSLLPPKAQAIIARRLGQLSPAAREVASVAAVIGRAFALPVLAQASELAADGVALALDELWQRRLVREQGVDDYDFSHDRIRDMAFATIPPARRRLLHRRVAAALESVYGDSQEALYGQLAVHYEQAGAAESAIAYYRRAVAAANRLAAHAEMVAHLNKVLALLDTLSPTPAHIEQKADVLLALGDAISSMEGFTAPEVERLYRQARDLCQRIGNDEKYFLALSGLRSYWAQRGHWQITGDLTDEMLTLAETLQIPIYLQDAIASAGTSHFHQGHFQEAHDFYVRALAVPISQPPATLPFDIIDLNLGTNIICRLALTLWFLGYSAQAQARMSEALTKAHGLRGPFEQLVAASFAFTLEWYMCRQPEANVHAEALIALAAKHHYSHWNVQTIIVQGWLLVERGETETGIALLRRGLDIRRQSGNVIFSPEDLTFAVKAYARAKQYEQALATVDEALAIADATGEHYWSAELHRLRGELLRAQGAAEDTVEGYYHQALEIARRQHAKSLELRTALSLAHLWRDQGRSTEAHDLVAAIYGWFTEGFDTPDLQAAQAFLAE